MADDPIRTYLDALKEMDKAQGAVEGLVNVIHDASKKLKRWRGAGVSDIKAPHIPPEVQLGRYVIRGGDWPCAQQLGEALGDWHRAYSRAQDAYKAVPKPDRGRLQPLPKYD